MKIRKKILPIYFAAILAGKKNFELRLNDFDCQEGDILILEEWDSKKKDYTGRILEKEITYVAKFDMNDLFWPKEEIEDKGIQIISIK